MKKKSRIKFTYLKEKYYQLVIQNNILFKDKKKF